MGIFDDCMHEQVIILTISRHSRDIFLDFWHDHGDRPQQMDKGIDHFVGQS